MRTRLLCFRAVLVALMSLMGLNAWAGADYPVEGKHYRIRNIWGASYLTMRSNDAESVSMSLSSLNSEYQFWELIKEDDAFYFRNVGWMSAGQERYIACEAMSSMTPLTTTDEVANNCLFKLEETNWNNWSCFNIVPAGANKLSWNSDMDGKTFMLLEKTESGCQWLFEEAELFVPEIVTLRSPRSGKYINENTACKLVQSSTVTETCKWIKYKSEDSFMFINYSTHNIIQSPGYNQQVTTGPEMNYLYGDYDESRGVWAFGNGALFLNERNGNDICGWTQGLNDAGSTWLVEKVGDITEEEVLDILNGGSPYLREVTEGVYFRIYSETLDRYMCDDYYNGHVSGKSPNEKDMTMIWQAIRAGKDTYYIENAATGRRLHLTPTMAATVHATAEGTELEPVVNSAFSSVNTYFNFIATGGFCPLVTGDGMVSTDYPGYKELSGAEWLLCRVDEIDEDALKAERESFLRFSSNESEYNNMVANEAQINKVLRELFADYACTEFTAAAQAMTDDEFAAKIASLPTLFKDMCLKMRNDSWPKTKGGRDLDKFFRIADYRAYSCSWDMCAEIGMSHEFTRLSNPTGISGLSGEIVAVMVDRSCPANAQLMLEIVDGGERDMATHGTTTALKRGLNLFLVSKTSDLFIFYEATGATNESKYYLERFPDIKIHIEGARVNGYFDLTRDMTDGDWADMVESGMLTSERVYLKGSHVIGNWPSSMLLPNNKTTITDLATFYNNIPKWEQELMGINDTYMPNVSKRFNNLYMALGTELQPGDYMYATTYGTYYNWGTLGTILSKSVLTNGGNQWGPAHEFGHNHQKLFNMVGCTEVSNNLFANMVIYKMGAAMSRGVALSALIPDYAENKNWIEHSIWCQTQMYWKLYQYFHLAGYDTEFFPKLFSALRRDPMVQKLGSLVPASTDYLRFAEACCEAADADLSEFFQMYGFFAPIKNDSEYEGVACKKIDDYALHYLYVTQDMIDATLAKMRSYEKKIKNIGFIDDRIRATPATYPGAPAGTMRSALNGGGANTVGSEGVVGMYLDYMAENYTKASGYTAKTVREGGAATARTLTVNINNDGEGAMGFKVFDSDDHLLYFYNNFSFAIPSAVFKRTPYAKDNIVILAADAQGNDQVIFQGDNYAGSFADGVTAVRPTMTSDDIYDLQGRKLDKAPRGLFIVNGKKVVR